MISMTTILPEGEIVGWKKAKAPDGSKCLVKLMIPSDAERSNATGRKCRASKAVVLEIQDMGGNPAGIYEARSCMHPEFIYRVGDTVAPEKPFCADRWEECASGIHFFITRDEAIRF